MSRQEWFIIHGGIKAEGALTQDDVAQRLREGLAKESLVVRAGREPVYVNDSQGLARLFETGPLPSNKLTTNRALRKSPHTLFFLGKADAAQDNLANNIFERRDHWVCATTKRKASPLPLRLRFPKLPALPAFSRLAPWVEKTRIKGVIVVLIGLACLPSQQIETEKKGRWFGWNFDDLEDTSLAARGPESLAAFSDSIEAKLTRNAPQYARSLLRLESQRNSFADGTLPAPSLSASVILGVLEDEELDRNPFWRPFLKRLAGDARKGLPVIAYEAARTRDALAKALRDAQRRGATQPASHVAFSLQALWGIEQMPGRGAALLRTDARDGFELMNTAVSRISALYPTVSEDERLFRSTFAATALWNGVQFSWLVHDQIPQARMLKTLGEWLELASLLSRPDREFVRLAIGERMAALQGELSAARSLADRQRMIALLHEELRFLCNPREPAIAADFFLQTLRMLQEAQVPPKLLSGVLEECFIGARAFSPTQKKSFDENELSLVSFFPRLAPATASRIAHERAFGSRETFDGLLERGVTPLGSWKLIAYLGGLVDVKPGFKIDAADEKCRARKLPLSLCLQLAWKMDETVEGRARIFPRLSDEFSFEDTREIGFGLAVQAYTRKLWAPGHLPAEGGRGGRSLLPPVEGNLRMLLTAALQNPHPEMAALEWISRNRPGFSK